jgi:hypothetical protein
MPWRCWIVGHRWTLILDGRSMYLVCQRCATKTPGWTTAAWCYLVKS